MTTTNFQIAELVEGQGQQAVTVNTALAKIDKALASYLSKSVAGSINVTLTATEWENKAFQFTGAITANISVIVPNTPRVFVVYNTTTGAFTLTIRTSAGTGVVVSSMRTLLICDGTDVYNLGAAMSFTTEDAQDAVGAMIDSTLTYVDGTPLLSRSALTGDVTASQGSNVTSYTVAASDTVAGKVELATTSETSTGTDTGRAVTPDGLAGSIFGTFVISIVVSDPNGANLTTGDGKAYWRVPSVCNGMNLVEVAAHVITVSTSGLPTVQIHNVTDAVDMLSTSLTIDANEKDSATAATPAVINTSNDDVATGDELRIDVDVAGTGTKGLMVELQFRLP